MTIRIFYTNMAREADMRHFQVDAHIYSKREIKRIARKTGKSRSEVVGAMVCLWGYVAVHSRDSGTIEGDYEDLADELDQDTEFWQAVESEGWLTCDVQANTVTVPEWQARFYTGSNSERCKTYRKNKAETKSERVASASQHVADQSRECRDHIDRVDKIIDTTEERIEEAAPAANLSSDLFEFKKNLQAAGMEIGSLPGWLSKAMSNGHASTYLQASRELAHTDLLSGDSPSHLGNFKNTSWVQRVANGEFSKGGPAPVDKESQRPFFPPAGKAMWPEEAKAWVNESDANRHAYEIWKSRSQKNADRDNSRGDTPPEGTPVPATIPPPVLKDPNESFDTAAAQRRALEQIAAFEKSNQGG